jgi:glycerol-3-phosphate dehydrogenase
VNAPYSTRSELLLRASEGAFDLLIIGGGIVGAGVARDAALRGIKTVLIDRYDFAFGTSSRSSRLLHGGIRYLAQGHVRLVREASVEKEILHRIAPHLAEPLPFIFPAYRNSSDWPFWQLRIGVRIYDLLCGGRNFGRSETVAATELERNLPALDQKDLLGAVRYFDAHTQDSRLVLDTLRSARDGGACLLNYARFEKASRHAHHFVSNIVDEESGIAFEIRSRAVVNATGPWSPTVPGSGVRLRLTKGIHLVFARRKLPIHEAVVITEGRRVLFLIPWGERLVVGTTDTDYQGPPEQVRSDPGDVEYLLHTVRRFFPNSSLEASDIISSWAGLRPLLADPDGNPSDISRSHQIKQTQPNWWDVAGGKLTTARLIAEQTVDQLSGVLGGSFRRCTTDKQPLLPSAQTAGISQIIPPPFSRGLVEHFCREEWALHLDDVLMRRSSWHFYDGPVRERAELCAEWMAQLLNWFQRKRDSELNRYYEASDFPICSEL